MQKLNELVELAKRATPGTWRRSSTEFNGVTATPFPPEYREVMLAHCPEKRDAMFIAAANPETILAIAEAFRALEQKIVQERIYVRDLNGSVHEWQQRAEAAEARVAELESGPKFIANIKKMSELAESQGLVDKLGNSCNHQWIRSEGRTASGWICNKCGDYEGPAPAINLAELVPREMVVEPFSRPIESQKILEARAEGFNLCRAAILRQFKEAK